MTTPFYKTKAMPRRLGASRQAPARSGTILPGLVVALVVTMAAVALVLDRLWLDAAATELRTSSEAAALAAARELVHDDLLCQDHNPQDRIQAAIDRAVAVTSQNRVAGEPVELDASSGRDILFGKLVVDPDSGITRFLQTTANPRTVRVRCCRERSRGNGLALWFRGITRQGRGDAVCHSEATANNQILGVRPFEGVPVPALPLAILKNDPTGQRADTWDLQIGSRLGGDEYRFNPDTGSVEQGSDGIPEIHLHGKTEDESANDSNVQLVDLNTDLRTRPLLNQFEIGWTAQDLKEFGGELLFQAGSHWLTSLARLDGDHAAGFEQLIGKPRICLLYSELSPAGGEGYGKLRAVDLIAGRIMDVRHDGEGHHVLIFQPTVLTTRTAVLADTVMDVSRLSASEQKLLENPYIYKLHLTR